MRKAFARALMGALLGGVAASSTLITLKHDAQAEPPASPASPASSTSISTSIPFEKFVLDNGLELILHEDHRTPVVAVNLWYHVGSKDEPAGRNGFAHLFEHVMFQGSRNVPEDTYFKFLEAAGASGVNGTTSLDRTNYFEAVPSNQLALALWLESDRMAFLLDRVDINGKKTADDILDETFKKQRDVVLNERRQNYVDAPYGLVVQLVNEKLYPEGHPYHLLTIGSPEDLGAATVGDVKKFFKTYYVPNNATLVIAGDLDKTKTRDLVHKYFGTIVRRPDPVVKTKPVPVSLANETRLAVEAGVELPQIRIVWPTPPFYAAGDAELDMVGRVLTEGKTSRLYKRLVYDMQIAQGVNAYQGSNQLSSEFEIVVTLKQGKSPEEALKVVDEELAKLRSAAPSDDEVSRARTGILASLVFANEKVLSRANLLNQYNQLTGDPGFLEKDIKRYEAVKAAEIQAATSAHLPPTRRIVAIVTPNPAAPKAGRLVGTP